MIHGTTLEIQQTLPSALTWARSRVSISAVILMTAMMTIPRSYAGVKLALIALFVALNFRYVFHTQYRAADRDVVVYYLLTAIIGGAWAMIGTFNGGSTDGIVDYLRLYVGWSVAYLIIVLLLKTSDAFRSLHWAIVIAGLCIAAINFIALAEYRFSLGAVPAVVVDQLDMRVGFHDGYVQITTQNIGSLFFICPYLIACVFRTDAPAVAPRLTRVALILTVLIAALSGRRALWIVLVLTPFLLVGYSYLTQTRDRNRGLEWLFALGGVVAIILALVVVRTYGMATISFLTDAFSEVDERTIQSRYLIDGFKDYPILGSGFGLDVGYIRSKMYPWLYELSYHQMLFNFGVVGVLIVASIFLYYMKNSIQMIAQRIPNTEGAFCLIVGLTSFLVGVYSNPYLGSFDFLLVLATLPLLASYRITGQKLQSGFN